jgi:hypothetical protein
MRQRTTAIAKSFCTSAVVVLLLAALPALAHAAAAAISGTGVAGKQIAIIGTGFSATPLSVTLDGHRLPILSNTQTLIVAALDPMPDPGTYRIVVKAGTESVVGSVTTSSDPNLVEQLHLTSQTTPIPETTLLVPPTNGLYRISVSMSMVTPSSESERENQYWNVAFNSPDESGARKTSRPGTAGYATAGSGTAGGLLVSATNPAASSSATWFVKAVEGVPITYAVSPSFPEVGGTYELSITVDQLE